ncbi:MerC domain-containing protein [Pseudoalteromonas mariniglutinosa]|uniref:MerC domain-containing protein n=1 Tax=Pseudoalteromonas mariniglutinosa TaxID=206042 RepID=UPI00384F68EB
MKTTQGVVDRLAIGFSVMCTIHCFATPVLLGLLPSLAVLQLNNEQFHLWVLAVALPTSLLALSLGCKKHKRLRYMLCGGVGLVLMLLAVTAGEALLGETAEKVLTLIGSFFVAIAHWFNNRQCQRQVDEYCLCSDTTSEQLN